MEKLATGTVIGAKSLGLPAGTALASSSLGRAFRACMSKATPASDTHSASEPPAEKAPRSERRTERRLASDDERDADLVPFQAGKMQIAAAKEFRIAQGGPVGSADPRLLMAQHAQAVLTQLRTAVDGRSVRMSLTLGEDQHVVVTVQREGDRVEIRVGSDDSNADAVRRLVRSLAVQGHALSVEVHTT